MKKITAVLVFVLALVLSACTKDDFGSKNIQVYTRDTASGTSSESIAFFYIKN